MFPYERSLVKRLEGEPFALIGVNGDRDLTAWNVTGGQRSMPSMRRE